MLEGFVCELPSTVYLKLSEIKKMKELSAKLQGNKRDCLFEGFVFELPNAVYPKLPEIKKIKELKAIWESWTVERQDAFIANYGDIALLLPIKIDE